MGGEQPGDPPSRGTGVTTERVEVAATAVVSVLGESAQAAGIAAQPTGSASSVATATETTGGRWGIRTRLWGARREGVAGRPASGQLRVWVRARAAAASGCAPTSGPAR
jgi:hypothetical protein